MSCNLLSPSIAAWLFFSAAYWPEDRGRAVLAVAAGLAALVGYALDGISSSAMGRAVVAGTGALLVLLDFGLAADAFGLGNLAVSGAVLVACGLAPHRRALATRTVADVPGQHEELMTARPERRRPSNRATGLAPVTGAV